VSSRPSTTHSDPDNTRLRARIVSLHIFSPPQLDLTSSLFNSTSFHACHTVGILLQGNRLLRPPCRLLRLNPGASLSPLAGMQEPPSRRVRAPRNRPRQRHPPGRAGGHGNGQEHGAPLSGVRLRCDHKAAWRGGLAIMRKLARESPTRVHGDGAVGRWGEANMVRLRCRWS
jgi:hypothetical protein